jgi:hypothetical protein
MKVSRVTACGRERISVTVGMVMSRLTPPSQVYSAPPGGRRLSAT